MKLPREKMLYLLILLHKNKASQFENKQSRKLGKAVPTNTTNVCYKQRISGLIQVKTTGIDRYLSRMIIFLLEFTDFVFTRMPHNNYGKRSRSQV